jgi:hypothetical protein
LCKPRKKKASNRSFFIYICNRIRPILFNVNCQNRASLRRNNTLLAKIEKRKQEGKWNEGEGRNKERKAGMERKRERKAGRERKRVRKAGGERIGKQYGERQGRWKGEGIEAGRECGKARGIKEIRQDGDWKLRRPEKEREAGREGNDRREKE